MERTRNLFYKGIEVCKMNPADLFFVFLFSTSQTFFLGENDFKAIHLAYIAPRWYNSSISAYYQQ